MFTKAFWQATGERSIKTFAQAWAAVLIANGTGLLDTEWTSSVSVAGMAALLSVLTSVGSAGVGPDGPSLGPEST
jgi:Putative lactococcus lactis phage r1t holin